MTQRIKYQPNQLINGVKFIREVEPHIFESGERKRKALFECECGNEFEAVISDVKSKHTRSCGCYANKITTGRNTTHGYNITYPELYHVWWNMIDRCYNKNNMMYYRYGGRGIKVCDEWQGESGLKNFIKWGELNGFDKKLTIDRANNDSNYEPSNCRFITKAENTRNSSATKLNWDLVREIRNTKLLIPNLTNSELAKAYGVSREIIANVITYRTWKE